MCVCVCVCDRVRVHAHVCVCVCVWSYSSHVARCGVTTSHSTCCGYFVRDYHISFRLFALSNPSVPTLCLKNPRRGVDTIQPDLILRVR